MQIGTCIHELGHAIGFYHEQARHDRNQYVRINMSNVEVGKEPNFDTENDDPHGVPYDYASIMHYRQMASIISLMGCYIIIQINCK